MEIKFKILYPIYFTLLWLLLNLQTLTIIGWRNDHSMPIKVFHLFSFLGIIFFILKFYKKFPKLPQHVLLFFLFIVIIGPLQYLIYDFNKLYLAYIYSFFIFCVGYLSTYFLSESKIFKILKIITLVINIIILVKLVFHREELMRFIQSPDGHPYVFSIYGGGVNLEASWLALSTAFFINRRFFYYILFSISLLVDILYASRGGLVISVTIFVIRFFSVYAVRLEKRFIVFVGLLLIVLSPFFIDYSNLIEKTYALKRFSQFASDQDKGMQGRFAMWQYYPEAMWESKFLGLGAGNSIYGIEKVSKKDFSEDNLHNLYMQILLEFGIIPLLLYLSIVFKTAGGIIKSGFTNPIGVLLIAYFIASMSQFRGASPIFWLILGLFFGMEMVKKSKNEK